MKKNLLALSLLYLPFCGTLSCLDNSTIPSKASDCLQRTPSTNNLICCYIKVSVFNLTSTACYEIAKRINSDEIKKKIKEEGKGLVTIEDFSCSGSYLKIGILLLAAFLLLI